MTDNTADNLPQRKSIRLANYDYTQAGAYFVTICTRKRKPLFGRITDSSMHLNDIGRIANDCWLAIPQHCPNVELDYFVVMPNHIHGILLLRGAAAGTACRAPTTANGDCTASPRRFGSAVGRSLASVIGSLKSTVTRKVQQSPETCIDQLWQRGYWEHIIRDERELTEVRRYIAENPLRWFFDRENPEAHEPEDALPWEPEPPVPETPL